MLRRPPASTQMTTPFPPRLSSDLQRMTPQHVHMSSQANLHRAALESLADRRPTPRRKRKPTLHRIEPGTRLHLDRRAVIHHQIHAIVIHQDRKSTRLNSSH